MLINDSSILERVLCKNQKVHPEINGSGSHTLRAPAISAGRKSRIQMDTYLCIPAIVDGLYAPKIGQRLEY
jgi:hypothetical protein